jgi:hypothetical protein
MARDRRSDKKRSKNDPMNLTKDQWLIKGQLALKAEIDRRTRLGLPVTED